MNLYWIKYLTLKKIINLFKIYLSYILSITFKKTVIWGLPYSLTTEPTNHCNLHCPECASGNKTSNRQQGFQDLILYKKIIHELKDYLFYHMVYFQGEPFLHSEIFKMIKIVDDNKIITSTSTNGHYLNKDNCEKIVRSGLKKIIISIDGTTQQSYEIYRLGGKLEKVISGVENLVSTKNKLNSKFPIIEIQFLVFKHNQHQIKEIKEISKKLGVNKLKLKSAQIEKQNKELVPSIKKYSRYTSDNYKIKNKLKNKCFRIWSTIVITWEGLVIPCCFDKTLHFKLGDLNYEDVKHTWKSSQFNEFRTKLIHNRKKIDICRNCSTGLRIKY